MPRSLLIVAFAACCVFHTQRAEALVLDWTGQTWAANPSQTANSNAYETDGSRTGPDVIITTTDNWNELGTPAVNQSLQGGNAQLTSALVLSPNMTRNTHSITVTIAFSMQYTQGVSNVSFSLFDIDQLVGSYQDQVSSISATLTDGSALAATISGLGSAVTPSGTGLSQVLNGNASSQDTGAGSGNGNATISFNADHIRTITFTIGEPNPSVNDPDQQNFGLGNITYSPVPEMNPALASAIACVAAFVIRRKLRRRAPIVRADDVAPRSRA